MIYGLTSNYWGVKVIWSHFVRMWTLLLWGDLSFFFFFSEKDSAGLQDSSTGLPVDLPPGIPPPPSSPSPPLFLLLLLPPHSPHLPSTSIHPSSLPLLHFFGLSESKDQPTVLTVENQRWKMFNFHF